MWFLRTLFPVSEGWARFGSAVSHVVMWIAVGVLTGHAHAADGVESSIDEKAIVITLPVFIISICSTAAFTWTVAKWDDLRTREVLDLKQQLKDLQKRFEEKS